MRNVSAIFLNKCTWKSFETFAKLFHGEYLGAICKSFAFFIFQIPASESTVHVILKDSIISKQIRYELI